MTPERFGAVVKAERQRLLLLPVIGMFAEAHEMIDTAPQQPTTKTKTTTRKRCSTVGTGTPAPDLPLVTVVTPPAPPPMSQPTSHQPTIINNSNRQVDLHRSDDLLLAPGAARLDQVPVVLPAAPTNGFARAQNAANSTTTQTIKTTACTAPCREAIPRGCREDDRMRYLEMMCANPSRYKWMRKFRQGRTFVDDLI